MDKPAPRPKDVITRDLLLSGLTFSSGAVDAISFIALGKVFTAFMTGNIAFLGLQLTGAGGPAWTLVLLAMAGFSAGIYLGTLIVKPKGQPGAEVWPRRVTLALGASLLWQVAFLTLWFAVHGRPDAHATHWLLGFWGAAMGMQSAAVRSLHVEGVFTTAATATFIFVMGDLATHAESPEVRLRLWGVLVALLLGALAGGFLLVHALILAPVLSFAVTALVVSVAAVVFRENAGAATPPRPAA